MVCLNDRFELIPVLDERGFRIQDFQTFWLHKNQDPIPENEFVLLQRLLRAFGSNENVRIDVVEKAEHMHVDFLYNDPICPLHFTYWLSPVPMDPNEVFQSKTRAEVHEFRTRLSKLESSTQKEITSLGEKVSTLISFNRSRVIVKSPSKLKTLDLSFLSDEGTARWHLPSWKGPASDRVGALVVSSSLSLLVFTECILEHQLFPNLTRLTLNPFSIGDENVPAFLLVLEKLLCHFSCLETLSIPTFAHTSEEVFSRCLELFCRISPRLSPSFRRFECSFTAQGGAATYYFPYKCGPPLNLDNLVSILTTNQEAFYPLDTLALSNYECQKSPLLLPLFRNPQKFPRLQRILIQKLEYGPPLKMDLVFWSDMAAILSDPLNLPSLEKIECPIPDPSCQEHLLQIQMHLASR